MKKAVKGLFCGAVASILLLNNGLSVGAAGLRDIFDAEYYAEKYSDLKETFGNDENALYQHFINYGIKEGRVMNPIIDVVGYRETYKDLQTAFGDDWDAYINHYFTYGVNEHRENGTDFDLLAYLNAYADLQAAYGNDYAAIAKHYEEIGIHENRIKASKAFARMTREAKENGNREENVKNSGNEDGNKQGGEVTDGGNQGDVNQGYEVLDGHENGSWSVKHYDGNDRLIYSLSYDETGELEFYDSWAYIYDEAGRLVKAGHCNSDGIIKYLYTRNEYDSSGNLIQTMNFGGQESSPINKCEYTYDDNGNMLTSKSYTFAYGAGEEEGRFSGEVRYTYDSEGNLLTETVYNEDGSRKSYVEYTYSNNVLTEKWENGDSWGYEYKRHEVFNEHGDVIQSSSYSSFDDKWRTITLSYEYTEDGGKITTIFQDGAFAGITKHNSKGTIIEESDSRGNILKKIVYNADGTLEKISCKYDSNGKICYKDIVHATFDGNGYTLHEEYNVQGDVVRHETHRGDKTVNDYDASYKSTYEYAEDGSKVETRYDLAGNAMEVIKYNSAGEVVE